MHVTQGTRKAMLLAKLSGRLAPTINDTIKRAHPPGKRKAAGSDHLVAKHAKGDFSTHGSARPSGHLPPTPHSGYHKPLYGLATPTTAMPSQGEGFSSGSSLKKQDGAMTTAPTLPTGTLSASTGPNVNPDAVSDPTSGPNGRTKSKGVAKKKKKETIEREVSVGLREKAAKLAMQLGAMYPNPAIPLDHTSNFQLLMAVILSAQTTDEKVNQVTPTLFREAPDAEAMAAMEIDRVADIIQRLGLAQKKAAYLVNTAKLLLERHSGHVPSTFAALKDLPGVGHKTASCIISQCFGQPAFPVDTHVHRLALRWGLTHGKSVVQTESDLKSLFPEDSWHDLHLQIIFFGRQHCKARGHDPGKCSICSWASDTPDPVAVTD